MPSFTISEIARQLGLRSSAIRYYEQIGLLPPPPRTSGQRRYDSTVLYRLAVIQRARRLGFSLSEIRELFFGFGRGASASRRWLKLSKKKLAQLDEFVESIDAMRNLLKKMLKNCDCDSLEQCGKKIFQAGTFGAPLKSTTTNRVLRHK